MGLAPNRGPGVEGRGLLMPSSVGMEDLAVLRLSPDGRWQSRISSSSLAGSHLPRRAGPVGRRAGRGGRRWSLGAGRCLGRGTFSRRWCSERRAGGEWSLPWVSAGQWAAPCPLPSCAIAAQQPGAATRLQATSAAGSQPRAPGRRVQVLRPDCGRLPSLGTLAACAAGMGRAGCALRRGRDWGELDSQGAGVGTGDAS